MKQDLGPNQLKWVEALESGEWKQCRALLQNGDRYCCLGVASVLAGARIKNGQELASPDVVDWLNIRGRSGVIAGRDFLDCISLAAVNDAGHTFRVIASFIRANPACVFRGPK